MKRTIAVFLGEDPRRIGSLHFDAQGARETAAFSYDATWLTAPDAFAIDPTLPLVAGPQFHQKVAEGSLFHGAISDTEPDGWARRVIMRDHGKRRKSSPGAVGEKKNKT